MTPDEQARNPWDRAVGSEAGAGRASRAFSLRGIRLALGDHPPAWAFGVAMYVDFAATESDWVSYDRDRAHLRG